jgi:hypothetical protein
MKKLITMIVSILLVLTTIPAGANQKYQLKIVYQASEKSKEITWSLTCRPSGGNHPQPKTACSEIRDAVKPFARPKSDEICTQIFGGPQRARVTGTWAGKKVNRLFTQANGCEIERWEQLQVTLSGKAK